MVKKQNKSIFVLKNKLHCPFDSTWFEKSSGVFFFFFRNLGYFNVAREIQNPYRQKGKHDIVKDNDIITIFVYKRRNYCS